LLCLGLAYLGAQAATESQSTATGLALRQ